MDLLQFISPERLVSMGAADYAMSGKEGRPKHPQNPDYMRGWNAQKEAMQLRI